MKSIFILLACTILCTSVTVKAQISSARLVAHYKLDGNGLDSSGNSLHGTVSNVSATTNRFGESNSACSFNGVNSKIVVANNPLLHLQDSFSISVWIYQEQRSNQGWTPVFTKRYSIATDPYESYGLTRYPGGAGGIDQWRFYVSEGLAGSLINVPIVSVTPFDEWLHIVCTYNKDSIKIYKNGVLESSLQDTSSIGYSNLDFLIGNNNAGPNEFYKGKIDDLRIYSRVLSDVEILQLFGQPNSIRELSNGSQISVHAFPNPTNDMVHIQSDIAITQIDVTDIHGKRLESFTDTQINLSAYQNGIYFLSALHADGNRSTIRIVKTN